MPRRGSRPISASQSQVRQLGYALTGMLRVLFYGFLGEPHRARNDLRLDIAVACHRVESKANRLFAQQEKYGGTSS
jgi:hypothetical protein